MSEKCIIRTKTKYEWDKKRNEVIYHTLKTLCDTTGKGCKIAEELKEKHTTKIDEVVSDCEII